MLITTKRHSFPLTRNPHGYLGTMPKEALAGSTLLQRVASSCTILVLIYHINSRSQHRNDPPLWTHRRARARVPRRSCDTRTKESPGADVPMTSAIFVKTCVLIF
ncbi:hypothetical protein EVAR_87549_1 [Eumeta japonica]|uniref:Uncharacterized protein n=1 Tax=Eumeta variegata TaxID=151549 RepID=A0A4C1XR99_EUMVA|nr:hypothetical protein EVAR_87549_1 [Eumeta japonica]